LNKRTRNGADWEKSEESRNPLVFPRCLIS
jgi:hypothetical protein